MLVVFPDTCPCNLHRLIFNVGLQVAVLIHAHAYIGGYMHAVIAPGTLHARHARCLYGGI